jgi:hypothetical protein
VDVVVGIGGVLVVVNDGSASAGLMLQSVTTSRNSTSSIARYPSGTSPFSACNLICKTKFYCFEFKGLQSLKILCIHSLLRLWQIGESVLQPSFFLLQMTSHIPTSRRHSNYQFP